MVACNRPIPLQRNYLHPSSYFPAELNTASAKQGTDNDISMDEESAVRIEEDQLVHQLVMQDSQHCRHHIWSTLMILSQGGAQESQCQNNAKDAMW